MFDIIDPTATVSADSSFVMSLTEFKTKILTAFENEIRVSFLLIVHYQIQNVISLLIFKIWTNGCQLSTPLAMLLLKKYEKLAFKNF